MARTNVKALSKTTHEGGPAANINSEQQLRRLVMTSLLWEGQFYVDGVTSADLIAQAIQNVDLDTAIQVTIEAKYEQNLRHTPLFMAAHIALKHAGNPNVKDVIARVIRRADEIPEFLAIYAALTGKDTKKLEKLHGQVKKGLAKAFVLFDEYQLAKYNRDTPITLKDAAMLVHPPHTEAIKKLVSGELRPPDTWEVALSFGAGKKETFTRLLESGNLGYLALLRNLRNMEQSGVDLDLVKTAIRNRLNGADKVLPFRFITAARHAPWAASALNDALLRSIEDQDDFDGETVFLLDHSGSMQTTLSHKGEVVRSDVAAGLAAIWPGEKRVYSFTGGYSNCRVVEISDHKGLAMISAYNTCQEWSGTPLGDAIKIVAQKHPNMKRFVVITDEQAADRVVKPKCEKCYMINVAGYQNGVGYGGWVHIDGWSENVIRFIRELEKQ